MKAIAELLKTLGPTRLAAMGAVAAVLIGIFATIIFRITAPQLVPLYTDLTLEDSSAVISQLESQAIPHEIRDEGATILVPGDDVFRLRIRLAEQGLPTGGSMGYEIFDKTDTLGSTSFVQNINHLRALEGELARTIRSIGRIVTARVHLVMPERQLFQRDRQQPSASIVLKVRGALDPGQVRAIQHLVATAVEGLSPQYISIVDESGRLLASGAGDDGESALATSLQEKTQMMEARLRQQVEEIVDSVVGIGRSRVRVAAEVDYNRITETQESYDPESQVVRSTQTKEENSSTLGRQGGVTAGNQLPGADGGQGGAGNRDVTNLNEEIVNYEISKSTKTEVIEAGGVKRLSVAVLVDGVYSPNGNGELVYEPRSAEELERIATLVRSAVGFSKARGDTVEVVNLRFAEAPDSLPPEVEASLFDFTRADVMRFIELGVLLLVALLLSLFVLRPLMKKMLTPEEPAQPMLVGADGRPIDAMAMADTQQQMLPEPEVEREHRIQWLEEAQAEGAVQVATITKVGEMIEDYPKEAVSIIRSWLNEAA
ncbi:flagellar M-ring protein FliF [Stappia sp. F7233]|uniref:Flagellar M-ring protein n=1 Tax=Stappia albiluteola TaxID=2758565 RepID=A0A839AAC0_9HYPH|nr:flagellar M-ring protein FliF [Stappia albiluteola]